MTSAGWVPEARLPGWSDRQDQAANAEVDRAARTAGAVPDLPAAPSLSDSARERLAYAADAVLREHTPLGSARGRKPQCRCGWRWSPGTDHTAHLAEALAGATSTNEAYVEMLAEVFGRG